MKNQITLVALLVTMAASGCASFRVGGEFQSGRNALVTGKTEVALSYFQSVAASDPGYVHGTAYRQGILSYLGRAEYSVGLYPQAQKTLERALAGNRDENLARLYLGLALARTGDQQRGTREIESGMKGIHGFIDYVTEAHRNSYGQFWDPAGSLRSAIRQELAAISGRESNLERLIASGETIGKQMEEEIDRAREDEKRERSRENDGGRGDSQP